MTNKLLAIIPCAGFGTRVSSYVPVGTYKELGCVGGSEPNILLQVEAMLDVEQIAVDILSIVIPPSKLSLKKAIKDKIHKLGFVHEISNLFLVAECPAHKRSYDTFIRNIDRVDQRVILNYVPDDLYKSQNPLHAIEFARASTSGYIVESGDKWDALIMFPDIHYTDLSKVVGAIQYHRQHNSGEYGLSSLAVKSVPELNPMKFGRHKRSGAGLGDYYTLGHGQHIDEIEFSTDNTTQKPTHLETGILYLPYHILFRKYPKEVWVYDMMINQDGPIYAIDITGTKIVDLGDPMSYINNAKDQYVTWKLDQ